MINLAVAVKPDDQVQPKIRSTPNGGCYISWFDNDPSGNPPFGYDVDLQRLDKHGVAQFPAGGIRLADLGMSSTQDYGLDVDAHGNALLAFLDDRRGQSIIVTVMKVDPAGNQRFGNYGRQVSDSLDFLGNPKVAATTEGSVVAGWIERQSHTARFPDWVSGACWVARREVLDRVGLFDERFFLYTEDVDLCARVRGAGYRVAFVPGAVVRHTRGASRTSVRDAANVHYRRSHVAFYEKHHPGWAALLRTYLKLKGALPDTTKQAP